MGARRHFRNNAAKGFVFLDLAEHEIGQNSTVATHNRGGGFIAACFQAK